MMNSPSIFRDEGTYKKSNDLLPKQQQSRQTASTVKRRHEHGTEERHKVSSPNKKGTEERPTASSLKKGTEERPIASSLKTETDIDGKLKSTYSERLKQSLLDDEVDMPFVAPVGGRVLVKNKLRYVEESPSTNQILAMEEAVRSTLGTPPKIPISDPVRTAPLRFTDDEVSFEPSFPRDFYYQGRLVGVDAYYEDNVDPWFVELGRIHAQFVNTVRQFKALVGLDKCQETIDRYNFIAHRVQLEDLALKDFIQSFHTPGRYRFDGDTDSDERPSSSEDQTSSIDDTANDILYEPPRQFTVYVESAVNKLIHMKWFNAQDAETVCTLNTSDSLADLIQLYTCKHDTVINFKGMLNDIDPEGYEDSLIDTANDSKEEIDKEAENVKTAKAATLDKDKKQKIPSTRSVKNRQSAAVRAKKLAQFKNLVDTYSAKDFCGAYVNATPKTQTILRVGAAKRYIVSSADPMRLFWDNLVVRSVIAGLDIGEFVWLRDQIEDYKIDLLARDIRLSTKYLIQMEGWLLKAVEVAPDDWCLSKTTLNALIHAYVGNGTTVDDMGDIPFVDSELSSLDYPIIEQDGLHVLPIEHPESGGLPDVAHMINDSYHHPLDLLGGVFAHLGYNYLGPGNMQLGTAPVSMLDQAAMYHDYKYTLARTEADLDYADRAFLYQIRNLDDVVSNAARLAVEAQVGWRSVTGKDLSDTVGGWSAVQQASRNRFMHAGNGNVDNGKLIASCLAALTTMRDLMVTTATMGPAAESRRYAYDNNATARQDTWVIPGAPSGQNYKTELLRVDGVTNSPNIYSNHGLALGLEQGAGEDLLISASGLAISSLLNTDEGRAKLRTRTQLLDFVQRAIFVDNTLQPSNVIRVGNRNSGYTADFLIKLWGYAQAMPIDSPGNYPTASIPDTDYLFTNVSRVRLAGAPIVTAGLFPRTFNLANRTVDAIYITMDTMLNAMQGAPNDVIWPPGFGIDTWDHSTAIIPVEFQNFNPRVLAWITLCHLEFPFREVTTLGTCVDAVDGNILGVQTGDISYWMNGYIAGPSINVIYVDTSSSLNFTTYATTRTLRVGDPATAVNMPVLGVALAPVDIAASLSALFVGPMLSADIVECHRYWTHTVGSFQSLNLARITFALGFKVYANREWLTGSTIPGAINTLGRRSHAAANDFPTDGYNIPIYTNINVLAAEFLSDLPRTWAAIPIVNNTWHRVPVDVNAGSDQYFIKMRPAAYRLAQAMDLIVTMDPTNRENLRMSVNSEFWFIIHKMGDLAATIVQTAFMWNNINRAGMVSNSGTLAHTWVGTSRIDAVKQVLLALKLPTDALRIGYDNTVYPAITPSLLGAATSPYVMVNPFDLDFYGIHPEGYMHLLMSDGSFEPSNDVAVSGREYDEANQIATLWRIARGDDITKRSDLALVLPNLSFDSLIRHYDIINTHDETSLAFVTSYMPAVGLVGRYSRAKSSFGLTSPNGLTYFNGHVSRAAGYYTGSGVNLGASANPTNLMANTRYWVLRYGGIGTNLFNSKNWAIVWGKTVKAGITWGSKPGSLQFLSPFPQISGPDKTSSTSSTSNASTTGAPGSSTADGV